MQSRIIEHFALLLLLLRLFLTANEREVTTSRKEFFVLPTFAVLGRPSSCVWRFCFQRDGREESLSSWVCHPEKNESNLPADLRRRSRRRNRTRRLSSRCNRERNSRPRLEPRDERVRNNLRREAKTDFSGFGETRRRNDIHGLHVVPNVLSIQIDHDVLEEKSDDHSSSQETFVTHQGHFHCSGIAFLDDRRHEVLQTLEKQNDTPQFSPRNERPTLFNL